MLSTLDSVACAPTAMHRAVVSSASVAPQCLKLLVIAISPFGRRWGWRERLRQRQGENNIRAFATDGVPSATQLQHRCGLYSHQTAGIATSAMTAHRPAAAACNEAKRMMKISGVGLPTATAASVASPIRCRTLHAAIGAPRKAHRTAHTALYWQAMQRPDALRWLAQTDR